MTAEPSIIKRKLKDEDLFIIFASDGLWEQLSDEAAVKIVFNSPRAVSFTDLMSKRWKRQKMYDNAIDIVIVFDLKCLEIYCRG